MKQRLSRKVVTFGADSVVTCPVKQAVSAGAGTPPAAMPAPVPFFFGPPDRRLFGWYHAPRPEAARDRAIVLCGPVGHELLHTHATYRYLAERLAAAGYPALRFDYDGTGDSFGSDEDADRVGSWLASIGWAIDTLRARSRTAAVSLFGVRLGATLAAAAAAERGDVQDLLLWAACRSGRSWRRELRVLHAAHGQPEPPAEQDFEEAGGFVFTRATTEALNQLDLAALACRPADRVLLMGRDDLPEDQHLGKSLAALGADVTQVQWPGYAAMMRDAQDTVIPVAAIDSLLGWLDGRSAPVAAPAPTVPPAKLALEDLSPPSSLGAGAYTEEPLLWGSRVFGILTRPSLATGRGSAAVLLLNVGANHHIGPNRMYVTLARQLAARGFLVLRLDLPGIGDSAAGADAARNALYSPSAVEAVKAAISHLEAHFGADRFTLVGLCSGAYTASMSAFEDPRVSGQILINPQTLEWNAGDSLEVLMRQSYKPTSSYFTLLTDPHALKRVLYQQVDVKGICQALGRRLAARGAAALRSLASLFLRRTPFETPAGRRFRLVAARGADTLLLFAAEDAGFEMTLFHLGTNARKIRGHSRLQVSMIEGADHTFTQKAAREQMLSLIARHLCGQFPCRQFPASEDSSQSGDGTVS